jgi:asparagine synthase (glutamine-hydrolysing)
MCGFTLLYKKTKAKLNVHEINKLRTIQIHRGPDTKSYKIKDNIYFFHNRLKIIDLNNSSNQPLICRRTGNIILFNGEIYNYNEIKQLYLKKQIFKTNSDTEVILKLYEKYGYNFFDKLNGIFSFVIYDKKNGHIITCRDRFGIKPLYCFENDKNLIFSTEIRPINLINNLKISHKSIINYLKFGELCVGSETLFKNVYNHDTSTVNVYSTKLKKRIKSFKFWHLKKDKNLECRSREEFLENYHYFFKKSLNLNLVSDQPIGLALSSGIDSSYLLNRLQNENLNNYNTYTFGWNNKKYDEINLTRNNKDINIDLFRSLKIDLSDFFENLNNSIFYHESPIGGFGTYALFMLFEKVKKDGVKVMLTGEGSDEFNLGYLPHHAAFLNEIKNKKKKINELKIFNKIYKKNLTLNEIKKYFLNNTITAPDGTSLGDNHNAKIISLNQMIKLYAFKNKLPKLLHFLDRCGGAHGIESRVPFLDHELVNFTYNNPPEYKIYNGQVKSNLIREYKNNKTRKKLLVATPQREFIKKNYKKMLNLLENGELVKNEFVDFKKIKAETLKYANSNKLGNSFFMWKYLNIEFFLKNFN